MRTEVTLETPHGEGPKYLVRGSGGKYETLFDRMAKRMLRLSQSDGLPVKHSPYYRPDAREAIAHFPLALRPEYALNAPANDAGYSAVSHR